jgi:GNAT superfamily N-acetyltransferase
MDPKGSINEMNVGESRMSLEIKMASEHDVDIITDMVFRLINELGGTPDRESYYQTCTDLLKQPQVYRVLLAFSELGQCVGMISFSESHAIYSNGLFGVIHEFYVLPEKRSSSIGRQLMKTVILKGRERKWNRIEVGAPNQQNWGRTISFYKREGFVEIGPRLKLSL